MPKEIKRKSNLNPSQDGISWFVEGLGAFTVGAGIGSLVGTVVFPGLGTIVGTMLGGVMGVAVMMVTKVAPPLFSIKEKTIIPPDSQTKNNLAERNNVVEAVKRPSPPEPQRIVSYSRLSQQRFSPQTKAKQPPQPIGDTMVFRIPTFREVAQNLSFITNSLSDSLYSFFYSQKKQPSKTQLLSTHQSKGMKTVENRMYSL